MKPRDYQDKYSDVGLAILRRHGILYYAWEERTGKTLTAILVCEKSMANNILVVTKKGKPMDGWNETLAKFDHLNNYDVINYHSIHKVGDPEDYDLVILDEAHNYISSYPKPSSLWKKVRKYTWGKPIIYLSATPHAQGYQQMYHQLQLSKWSPWRIYKNFYDWFKVYGFVYTIDINGLEANQYDRTDIPKITGCIAPFFLSMTRKELGFEHEPEDKVHWVTLSKDTKELYNEIVEHGIAETEHGLIVADTTGGVRASLHQIEGGSIKIDKEYYELDNTEKIGYIKETWGDTEDMVIMYNYKGELPKLKKHFKKATILQATTNAEGVELAHKKHLIVYSQDWSTARHTQRRARQASKDRDIPIDVHFILVKGAVSHDCYKQVAVNKKNFVDSVYKRKKI